MSRDIRSFFQVTSKKPSVAKQHQQNQPPKQPEPSPAAVKKRKAKQISSDEETSPKKTAQNTKLHNKKRRVIDSDDDEEHQEKTRKVKLNKLKTNKPPVKQEAKIKPVDLSTVFGNDVPKRKNKTPVKKESEILLNSDDEFEETIKGIDPSVLIEDKPVKVKQETDSKVEIKENGNVSSIKVISPEKGESSKVKQSPKVETTVEAKVKLERKIEKNDESDQSFHHNDHSAKGKGQKKHDLDSSVLSDEERHERKRLVAILYQKYKNRQSVINPGCKEIPEGRPNCLAGLSFLVTGVLQSMEREEAQNLIKKLGGKVSSTVGKRLNYMIVGEEAGPKKLATAEELGIPQITEDQLFDLIGQKSKGKDGENGSSSTSEVHEHSSKEKGKTEKEKVQQKKSPLKRTAPSSSSKEDVVKAKKSKMDSPKEEIDENVVVETKESDDDVKRDEIKAWVEKYKPTSTKQLIGQQGAASPCTKLLNWLKKWYINHDGKKKPQKPNPWAKNDDGSYYKAALLSGPPGIGKTTTASLVCKELGFDIVEFNASDTRSKKSLKEEVSELLSNKSLYGYFHGENKTVSKKHVLIMDEVDGMAGNEDRGGMQELIALIKDSAVPIICMCNDRNHPKIRSLVNYCYDLKFMRPRVEQIKSAIMSICFKEKLKLPPGKIEEIITATNHDIRQTLNFLSLLSAGKELTLKENDKSTAKKDLKLGPWDVVRKVFSADEHKQMTLNDKSDLFFHDYSLSPLFVQENYLSVAPHVPKSEVMKHAALTADALSLGDLIDKKIRSNSAWALLPTQAMFSSVLPGEYMAGHFTGQINFPSWLGKNSKQGKRSRLAQEIHDHTRIRTSGSRLSIRLDYAPFLLDAIVRPLKKGPEHLEESLNVIKEYHLLREDIDSLVELTSWPGKKNPMDGVDSKVKAALTRTYNKEVLAYSYSATAGIKKKKSNEENDLTLLDNENEAEEVEATQSDDEDKDNLELDALIKTKKKDKKAASSSSAPSSKASTSKKSTSSRGGKSKK